MSALVTSARKYLGAPFQHRGRTAKGLDCAGLAWLAYADLGYTPPDLRRYGRTPHRDGLMQAMSDALGEPAWEGRAVPRELLQVGDVVVMRFVEEPHHVAIVCDSASHGLGLIHCYGNIGRVVEHGLDAMWQDRILAVFRRPV
ncbi:C40 family peptidase [Variovorax sp. LT1R16]|uniref:C40 family peptidase n=1 Tax=Variovorax sp. LT1R16 TaxID=3443728 RepID=UPI003F472AE1